jgi:hypothetical protein
MNISSSTNQINQNWKILVSLQSLQRASLMSIICSQQQVIENLVTENNRLQLQFQQTSSFLSFSDSDDLVILLQNVIKANKLPQDCFTRTLFSAVLEALLHEVLIIPKFRMSFNFSNLFVSGSTSDTMA